MTKQEMREASRVNAIDAWLMVIVILHYGFRVAVPTVVWVLFGLELLLAIVVSTAAKIKETRGV